MILLDNHRLISMAKVDDFPIEIFNNQTHRSENVENIVIVVVHNLDNEERKTKEEKTNERQCTYPHSIDVSCSFCFFSQVTRRFYNLIGLKIHAII